MLSSKSFIVSSFAFIHPEFFFVYVHGKGPVSFFYMLMFFRKTYKFSGKLSSKTVLSLLNDLLILVKNQLTTEVSLFLCSQFYLSILMPEPQSLITLAF